MLTWKLCSAFQHNVKGSLHCFLKHDKMLLFDHLWFMVDHFPRLCERLPLERYWVTQGRVELRLDADFLYFVRKWIWNSVSPQPSMLHITLWAFSAFEKPLRFIDMLHDVSKEVLEYRKNKCASFILLGKKYHPKVLLPNFEQLTQQRFRENIILAQ